LHATPPLIIVDEAQDTDAHAWRCIELLSATAQIVCLADLDQQIFDYLPGIGPERVDAIRQTLAPLEIDLGGQNHRSSGTIAIFGQDILTGRARGAPMQASLRSGTTHGAGRRRQL
jgi:DNA helicase-2/ATP-dependent DNA helicase PcrA